MKYGGRGKVNKFPSLTKMLKFFYAVEIKIPRMYPQYHLSWGPQPLEIPYRTILIWNVNSVIFLRPSAYQGTPGIYDAGISQTAACESRGRVISELGHNNPKGSLRCTV